MIRVKAELEFNQPITWIADSVEPPVEGVAIQGNGSLRPLYINGKRVGVVGGYRQETESVYTDDSMFPYDVIQTRFTADAILEFE